MRKHVTAKVKINEEMTRVAKCPFKKPKQYKINVYWRKSAQTKICICE